MRIAVLIGRVLDPAGITVNRRHGRVFVNRENYILHPADRSALEAALRIKDASGAEVVALPRGPLADDDVLRQAVAHGADRAIVLDGGNVLVADDAAMAKLLAALVHDLGDIDLLLAGAETLDTEQSQLGPRLAEALGWAQIVGTWQVKVGNGCVEAIVRDASGFVSVEADLPAVVTVEAGALNLRYPDGVRLINVYRAGAGMERRDVTELVSEADLRHIIELRGQEFPPERERGVRVAGTAEQMAQAVANQLLPVVRG